jgi:hypothetical protein
MTARSRPQAPRHSIERGRKVNIWLPVGQAHVLAEIQAEAVRLQCSVSELIRRAWEVARSEVRLLPTEVGEESADLGRPFMQAAAFSRRLPHEPRCPIYTALGMSTEVAALLLKLGGRKTLQGLGVELVIGGDVVFTAMREPTLAAAQGEGADA